MEPYSVKFGGGVSGTVLHPLVLAAMLLSILLFFILPRKYVVVPLVVSTFLIPLGQQIYAGGVHLFVCRLIILFAFIRAVSSRPPGEKSIYAGGWTKIDTAFTCYVVIQATATLLLFHDSSALVNQVGVLWDFLIGYLGLRSLIRTDEDIYRVIKCYALVMVVLAAGMIIEQKKMMNIFGQLGGVALVPEVREDKIRSQGVFQHSLTAGTFAATAIPLFFLMWRNAKARVISVVGIVAATIMTLTTQTSTSLLTYMAGVGAVLLWPIRKKMKQVRWAMVTVLVGLHLVMKAPVWFLIARIDLTGSSSSYHRAELIDQFVNHFSSWWLIGTNEAATWGWDMWDAQNMFVSVGEAGGLAALAYYILVISRSYSRLGEARTLVLNRDEEWFMWFLGSAVFANVVAFFGVNYFDQSRMGWFALLAMVVAFSAPILGRVNAPASLVAVNEVEVFSDQPVLVGHREEIEPSMGPVSRHLFD